MGGFSTEPFNDDFLVLKDFDESAKFCNGGKRLT